MPERIARPIRGRIPSRGRIAFDRVSFSYGGEAKALDQVSFEVKPGETLALLGPSGSGKTSIVSLLLRLYDPTEGTIMLDGREIRRLGRREVRSRIGAVLQEPFLYSKSLRENIRLGRAEAEAHDIVQAAGMARVHDAILEFEQGYDTLVGERGVTLSGGQRQRVALARALLARRDILILDDALSAVDTETESMILRALKGEHGRRTTIVIAHRLSTVMHADQILVLEHGRVVEAGTHRELAAREGLYRRLWRIQGASEGERLEHSLAE